MSYKISGGFADTQDNLKNFSQKGSSNDSGPYIAVVKNTVDPLKMGRLGVVIPELSRTDGHDINPSQVIWCQYLSPFYGAKPFKANTREISGGKQQRSYGMWAIPPDIDTNVLVIFAKGEKGQKNAFWLGCIQEPLTNHMVPGMGASENTENNTNQISNRERQIGANAGVKLKNYGTNFLPVQEKNKKAYSQGESIEAMNQWKFPVNDVLAEQLFAEGLIKDDVRGTTSSSARRETPSQVFGWNTPGAISKGSRELNIGLNSTPIQVDRDLGHCFVLDDGDENGKNKLARIRTASGHQLLMHDTDGVVYLANGSGKAFIEMSKDGTVSIYSASGINIRSGGDFNLHSDTHINFHAKGSLNFTAEQNVNHNAGINVNTMAKSSILNSAMGGVSTFGGKSITSYTTGQQLHGAGGQFHLQGSQVHFNMPMGSPRPGGMGGGIANWGPSWLVPEHESVGIITTNGKDIDIEKPIKEGGKPNTIDVPTTVSDFVTHEPYTRTSSEARKKNFINETMSLIAKQNPDMMPVELREIKNKLESNKTVSGVTSQVKKLVALNDKIKLPLNDIKSLSTKAKNIENIIKNDSLAFVKGKLSAFSGQISGYANQAVSAVRSFFRF
jgi:hypothetical protein